MPLQIVRPNSTIDNGGWAVIGAPTHHEALDEEVKDDDVSYVECVPGNTMLKIGFSAEEPRTRFDHVFRMWATASGSGKGESLDGWMYQGETLIAQLYSNKPISRLQYGYYWRNLGDTEAELITDYSALEVYILYNSLAEGEYIRITMLEFELPFPQAYMPPVMMII